MDILHTLTQIKKRDKEGLEETIEETRQCGNDPRQENGLQLKRFERGQIRALLLNRCDLE